MKPLYSIVKKHHYSSAKFSSNFVSGENLYEEIGYDQAALVKQNASYENTCATRMSLALIKSGMPVHGRLRIKAGQYKGKFLEPGAKLLADQLSKSHLLGKPKIFKNALEAAAKLEGKRGIIFFWKIEGYRGGHIDLIGPLNKTYICNSVCFPNSSEIWFWSLD